MTAAELRSVRKQFGPVVALDNVDLSIRPGELVSLLGSNGAGKTTAVRVLLGLTKPTSGMARIFNNDPRNRSARTNVGAMLQVARIPETLRVREHIQLFSSYYPNPLPFPEIVRAASLNGIEHKLFGDLSGGQKQRVLFGLAICGNPKLLFLDEPTVGLDIQARRAFWDVVRDFVRRGGSALLTTHYLEEADALSDRVVVIDKGKVIAEGTPSDLKQRTTGRRIRCSTTLSLPTIREIAGVTDARSNGLSIEILSKQPERTVRELLALDTELSGLEITSAGLDDAFLSIIHDEKQEVAAV